MLGGWASDFTTMSLCFALNTLIGAFMFVACTVMDDLLLLTMCRCHLFELAMAMLRLMWWRSTTRRWFAGITEDGESEL
jgi:hypothetical protein